MEFMFGPKINNEGVNMSSSYKKEKNTLTLCRSCL
jgi:hypothetical protein